jgi:large subunit ribosomal protein L10
MPNQKNIDSVKQLEIKLKSTPNLIVTKYVGMSTPDLNGLRDKLRPLKCEYNVMKNTLTRIALKNAGIEEFAKYFSGPTAVAFHTGDPCALSKAIMDYAKTNEKLQVLAGYLDGKILTDKQIKAMAGLPSREVLLAQLAATLNAPIQQIAVVLNAPIQKLALVLKSLEQQKAKAAA